MEQVVAAAPDVAWLVERCPSLRVVITSRTPLRIAAEQEYSLAPLSVPPAWEIRSAESLLAFPSVALFVERARKTNGSFELTAENGEAVAAACRRLDGLPLALELAAARLRLLTPEALLERLGRILDVLTSGQRDAPERHQTLRATIAWSHSLLSEPEQRLFRRMAVFVGGGTVADVEAICASAGASCLDELESLLDNALVQLDGQRDRLGTLQTIGEFAREQLGAAGRTARLRCGTLAGTSSEPARSATGSKAPNRSARSKVGSPRRGTSKRRSRPCSRALGAATQRRPNWACKRAGICGCTGTCAVRTSPRGSTRPPFWQRTPAAPRPPEGQAR